MKKDFTIYFFLCFFVQMITSEETKARLPDLLNDGVSVAANPSLRPLDPLIWTNESLAFEKNAFEDILLQKTVRYMQTTNSTKTPILYCKKKKKKRMYFITNTTNTNTI